MKRQWTMTAVALATVIAAGGCVNHNRPEAPLGSISDSIWQRQEHNAEASDFVVHQHEFAKNSARLNLAGEDHVKQIALRLGRGQNFPVVIERSMMTAKAETEYRYPVHPNPELDMQRRAVVARALSVMGVGDADQRVVVAPAFAEGYRANEAIRAYYRAMFMGGGFGGGGFGGGVGGGGGGFGGGF